jgi:hypothetical protein
MRKTLESSSENILLLFTCDSNTSRSGVTQVASKCIMTCDDVTRQDESAGAAMLPFSYIAYRLDLLSLPILEVDFIYLFVCRAPPFAPRNKI